MTLMPGRLRLTKHHGLGNDFLVLIDREGTIDIDPELARAVCHRTTGIGADGLLWARPPEKDDTDLTMVLLNADGSRAEMSGNGIRCLVQAARMAKMVDHDPIRVGTDGGVREVDLIDEVAGEERYRVDMGPAKISAAPEGWIGPATGGEEATMVDVGNPHLVIWGADPGRLDQFGRRANAEIVGGANVEVIDPTASDRDRVTMTVYERGVGQTMACGTGAVATLAAAHHWGRADQVAEVRMPGGAVIVEAGPTMFLTGPAVWIGDVEIPWPLN